MKPVEPLALNHSWPLYEHGLRLDLGQLIEGQMPSAPLDGADEWLRLHGIGRWSCNLSGQSLTWSTGVYDLFDWRRNWPLEREGVLRLYREESRAALERLRSHAIRHRRGFTIDIALRGSAGNRWVRVIGAPQCRGARVVALHGWKKDVTNEYR